MVCGRLAEFVLAQLSGDILKHIAEQYRNPSVGPQAIEKIFKTQFESGFRHIDLEIDQVSPFGTDAAITVGRYEITGRGQDGPLKVDGRRTEVEVREGGVWKIRHSTVVPKIEPNPIIPRMEANSITPRTEGDSVSARIAANSIIPRMEAIAITPGIKVSPIAPRLEFKQARPAPTTEAAAPREAGEPIMAIVSIRSSAGHFLRRRRIDPARAGIDWHHRTRDASGRVRRHREGQGPPLEPL